MTGHTHTLAEWAAFLGLGLGVWATGAAVVWLIADAEASDFDPRPAVRGAHQAVVYAARDLDRAVAAVRHELAPAAAALLNAAFGAREAARDLAALLLLLTTSPKGFLA